jgi:FMN phosphatase YigB (HAD superfamily)
VRRKPFARFAPSALLTDVWYTLVYYRKSEQKQIELARRRTWARALTSAGVAPSRARAIVHRFEQEGRLTELAGRTPPLWERIRAVGRAASARLDAGELVEELDRIVREFPPQVAAGAVNALRALRARGVRVGIVSNVMFESAGGARRLLDHLQLSGLADAVVLSADDGIAKPDPRPYLKCLRELDVAPAQSWYIGDLSTDVTGALAAGMRPLRYVGLAEFGPAYSSTAADALASAPVVRHWSELTRSLNDEARTEAAEFSA